MISDTSRSSASFSEWLMTMWPKIWIGAREIGVRQISADGTYVCTGAYTISDAGPRTNRYIS